MLRRWRGRNGIAAAKVSVRTESPWYWRSLGWFLIVALGVSGGLLGYDYATRAMTSEPPITPEELAALRSKLDNQDKELSEFRASTQAAQSQLTIEKAAQDQLLRRVKTLEEENAKLRQELGVIRDISSGGNGPSGPVINTLQVDPDAAKPGRFHYRMLVSVQGQGKNPSFKGGYQLSVKLVQDGKNAMMTIPGANEAGRDRFRLDVRQLQRVEGVFDVPPGAHVVNVEARLVQDGTTKATKSVAF